MVGDHPSKCNYRLSMLFQNLCLLSGNESSLVSAPQQQIQSKPADCSSDLHELSATTKDRGQKALTFWQTLEVF